MLLVCFLVIAIRRFSFTTFFINMIIAFSGSQGSGKTTLLEELSKRGYNVIARKTSRSVLSDWDMTLSEVYADHKLMMAFQDEIFERKLADEQEALLSNELWLTDRSYVDILGYTIMVLGSDIRYGGWLQDYHDRCVMAEHFYQHRVYVPRLNIKVVGDGCRSVCPVYSKAIDHVMRGFQLSISPANVVELTTSNLTERILEVKELLQQY